MEMMGLLLEVPVSIRRPEYLPLLQGLGRAAGSLHRHHFRIHTKYLGISLVARTHLQILMIILVAQHLAVVILSVVVILSTIPFFEGGVCLRPQPSVPQEGEGVLVCRRHSALEVAEVAEV